MQLKEYIERVIGKIYLIPQSTALVKMIYQITVVDFTDVIRYVCCFGNAFFDILHTR
jgi:hypothetical protein